MKKLSAVPAVVSFLSSFFPDRVMRFNASVFLIGADYNKLVQSYAIIYCTSGSSSDNASYISILAGCMQGGTPLEDPELCWGSVDGFRLVVMKKEWLVDSCKKYYDQGDGEWFVTTCLINGIQLSYAIALRTALIRALKLTNATGKRPIEEIEKGWATSWNAEAVHQTALDIEAGKRPKGVEIRYTGQTQPNWWIPGASPVVQRVPVQPNTLFGLNKVEEPDAKNRGLSYLS